MIQHPSAGDVRDSVAQREVSREEQDAELTRYGEHSAALDLAPAREELCLTFDPLTSQVEGLFGDGPCDETVDGPRERELMTCSQGRESSAPAGCARLSHAPLFRPLGREPGRGVLPSLLRVDHERD